MKSEFMGAFRHRKGDQDRLERYLRLLRCFFLTTVSGSIWSVSMSFYDLVHEPMAFSVLLTSTLIVSMAMFLFRSSYEGNGILISPLHRSYLAPCVMVLLIAAVEAAPPGWWNQPVVLQRLRYGVLFVAGAWVLLWAGEKAVQLRRSRR